MVIGLIDVDGMGKSRKSGGSIYPNLALCKIAGYHKDKGDEVMWYDAMYSGHCDIVYMSKIFNFSPDYLEPIDADVIIKGGTGYDIHGCLPQEIDDHQPDFTIYPEVDQDTSFGFLTRGCPNKCNWCVVPKKEGAIKPYWDIERVANGKKKVVLMDNNIMALPEYAKEQFNKIISLGLKVDFNQALDARLVTPELADLLAKMKWIKSRIRFGCDTKKQIAECDRAIDMISERGFKGHFFLYTMLQGSFKECYERINHYKQRNYEFRKHRIGREVYPYAQPYRDPNNPNAKIPQWQKDMAGWVNKRAIFEQCFFEEFSPRKGFKCEYYVKTLM